MCSGRPYSRKRSARHMRTSREMRHARQIARHWRVYSSTTVSTHSVRSSWVRSLTKS